MSTPKGFKVIRTPEEAAKHAQDELLHQMNNVKPVKGKRVSYHVKPRYSPGSPAMVDFGIAKRVAYDEASSRQRILTGFHGEAETKRAQEQGLEGIVYAMDERSDCWLVTDLITGRQWLRMFDRQFKTPSAQLVLAKTLSRKYLLNDVRSYDGDQLVTES